MEHKAWYVEARESESVDHGHSEIQSILFAQGGGLR
jgi:hypothetical protein